MVASRFVPLACTLMLVLTNGLLGQTSSSPAAVTTADSKSFNVDVGENPAVTVGEFVLSLKEKVPNLQFVIQPGPWQQYVLPRIHLENVTLDQVFRLLSALDPDFMVNSLSDPSPGGLFGTKGEQPPAHTFILGSAQAGDGQAQRVSFRAFGLSDPINRLTLRTVLSEAPKEAAPGGGAETSPRATEELIPDVQRLGPARKQAMKEILSLLEASAIQSGESRVPASLKLHEETEVLLVKGTAAQISAISQALEAITAGGPNEYAAKFNRAVRLLSQEQSVNFNLRQQLKRVVAANQTLQQKLNNLEKSLRQRLPQTSPAESDHDRAPQH